MKKWLLLLPFISSISWGTASLTMGTPVVSSDGLHVSIAITGVSGSLSPSTAITGFSVGGLNGGNPALSISSATSAAATVTLTLAAPVQNTGVPTFSLATVGGGSNLTDTGGNTPSAAGNTAVASTNNSTWYGCSASGISSKARYNGGPVLTDSQGTGYTNPCYWASSDGGLTINASGTAINIWYLSYGTGWTLFQDGVQLGTAWNGTGVIYSSATLASGLSGTHLYDFVSSSGSFVGYNTVLLPMIQFVGGGPTGTAPTPARPVIHACGDSIVGSGSTPNDALTVDWWLNSIATQDGSGNYGYCSQINTESGNTVVGGTGLAARCPTRMYPYDQTSPIVGVLEGGTNDMFAGTATGTVTSAGTFAGDYVTMIRGVQTNAAPPTNLLVQGILDRDGLATSSATYINAEINAVNYVNATYGSSVCFFNTSGWISVGTHTGTCVGNTNDTSDGIHPCGASVAAWNGRGYAKLANRKIPIFAGYISGASYTTSGPTSGTTGAASTNFTVSLTTNAKFTGDQAIILNDGGAGGTFTPSVGSPGAGPLTVTPTGGISSFTFTYTPTSSGVKTITYTNGQSCWTNPSSTTYTASAASTNPQSLVLASGLSGTFTDPALGSSVDSMVEFQLHNFGSAPATGKTIFNLTGVGMAAYYGLNGSTPYITFNSLRDSVTPSQGFQFSVSGKTNMLFRFRRIISLGVNTGEAWDYDGTNYQSFSYTISSNAYSSSGGAIGDVETDISIGFIHVSTTNIPALGARLPVTATTGTYTNLKFDGTLTDTSGNGHNATLVGATYADTPNITAFSKIKTLGAPFWSNWISLRAGSSAGLDGTNSFTMIAATSSVSCFWNVLSGPTIPVFDSRTSCLPHMTGLVFGQYGLQLQVTDTVGNVAISTLNVGAVATDTNSVIVPALSTTTDILGPQIAFGANPWGYQDERNLFMIGAQRTYEDAYYDKTWTTTGQGTISYPFAGIGIYPGPHPGATITADITGSSTSFPVSDASFIDFTSTPTWIMLGSSLELVRIASATATSGPATLYVAYDGRGLTGNAADFGGWYAPVSSQSWPSGTSVSQLKITGTGTLFATDANRPMCAGGVPGPIGEFVRSSGTVTLSSGSTTVTGSGAGWTSGNGILVGQFIRVAATHDSGTSYVYWAQIVTITDSSHVVVNRPAPSKTDAGPFTYKITSQFWPSLEFTAPDGHVARQLFNVVGCESETAAYGIFTHDVPALDMTVPTGVKYSYKRFLGLYTSGGTTSTDFYGVGLAARNFYYRSGYAPALQLANDLDEYAVRDPEIADGYAGGNQELTLGGPVLGSMVSLILNPSTILTWPNVEKFAVIGEIPYAASCNDYDARVSGYIESWLALTANYDTNVSTRAGFKTALNAVLEREKRCARPASEGYTGVQVNSFANASVFSSTITVGLSTGSVVVSTPSSPMPPSMCNGISSGTITVTNGSASAVKVSGTVAPGIRITVVDTSSSPIYVGAFQFSVSGASVSLAGIWPGTSGTYNFMVDTDPVNTGNQQMSIWTDNSDTFTTNMALQKNWTCIWNSTNSLTLNRPWDAATGTSYKMSSYTVGQWYQQPFMVGIKSTAMNFASHNDSVAISTTAASFSPLIGNWMHDYGWDSATTLGTYYARVNSNCEPGGVSSGSFYSIHGYAVVQDHPACGAMGSLGTDTARANSAEAGTSMVQYYLANPTAATKLDVDKYYGAVFGNCTYTTGGAYCDSHYITYLLSDTLLGSAKWPGFFFGVGGFFSSSWPAVRLGPVVATLRTLQVGFKLSSVTNATKVRVSLTRPSGQVVQNTCTSSPCAVTGDVRQGSHLVKLEYLSSSDAVLATGEQQIQGVN